MSWFYLLICLNLANPAPPNIERHKVAGGVSVERCLIGLQKKYKGYVYFFRGIRGVRSISLISRGFHAPLIEKILGESPLKLGEQSTPNIPAFIRLMDRKNGQK